MQQEIQLDVRGSSYSNAGTSVLQQFVDKNVTGHKRWRANIAVMLIIIPLLFNEFDDMTNKEIRNITGCAANDSDEKTMQNCQDLQVIICQNGLQIDLSGLDKNGNIGWLLVLAIAIVFILEMTLLQLQGYKSLLIRLLRYGYYVQIKLKRFIINIVLFTGLVLLYLYLKYSTFQDLTAHDSIHCNGNTVYVSVDSTYGKSPFSVLTGISFMFVAFGGMLCKIMKLILRCRV